MHLNLEAKYLDCIVNILTLKIKCPIKIASLTQFRLINSTDALQATSNYALINKLKLFSFCHSNCFGLKKIYCVFLMKRKMSQLEHTASLPLKVIGQIEWVPKYTSVSQLHISTLYHVHIAEINIMYIKNCKHGFHRWILFRFVIVVPNNIVYTNWYPSPILRDFFFWFCACYANYELKFLTTVKDG